MALRETDQLPVRIKLPAGTEEVLPRVAPSVALPPGRVQMATMAELRSILGIEGGTYTPTVTEVANLTSSTALPCMFARFGGFVLVFGTVTLDPAAGTTLTTFRLSLPVASNFAAATDLAGTVICSQGASVTPSSGIEADVANDEAVSSFFSGTGQGPAENDYNFSFMYRIL